MHCFVRASLFRTRLSFFLKCCKSCKLFWSVCFHFPNKSMPSYVNFCHNRGFFCLFSVCLFLFFLKMAKMAAYAWKINKINEAPSEETHFCLYFWEMCRSSISINVDFLIFVLLLFNMTKQQGRGRSRKYIYFKGDLKIIFLSVKMITHEKCIVKRTCLNDLELFMKDWFISMTSKKVITV